MGPSSNVSVNDSAGVSGETTFGRGLEVTYFCLGLPLGVAVCLGNIILLSVVAPKKGPLRDSTRTLLAGLVLSDIAAGLLFMVHVVMAPFQHHLHQSLGCLFWAGLLTAPVLASFLLLTAILWERKHFVCVPAAIISRRKAMCVCAGLGGYCLLLAILVLAFSSLWTRGHLCDLAAIPPYYLLIPATHIAATLLTALVFAVKIKSTLQLHQRKIQVTNTITYNNLVEDARVAWLFFLVYALHLAPWIPLIIVLAVLAAGVNTSAALISARVFYLIGQISGLKFLLYLWRNKEILKATKKRLGCSKTPPRHSPAHTLGDG